MERITSVKNERVKQAAKLVSSAKARRESGLFVLEGLRLCMDVVRSDLWAVETFVSEEFCARHGDSLEELSSCSDAVYVASDAVLAKLSDTQTPQGVVCVARMPAPVGVEALLGEPGGERVESVPGRKLLLLENVQDPANLGAASRTAEALGIDGLVVSGGCDVYAPKALRASMGALLRLPVVQLGTSTPVLSFLDSAHSAGFRTFASTPDSSAVPVTDVDFSGNCLVVVGNEANGVTPETQAACTERITIPMTGRAESLNAGAAASILLWELVR